MVEIASPDIWLTLLRGGYYMRRKDLDRGILGEMQELTRVRADEANGHNPAILERLAATDSGPFARGGELRGMLTKAATAS